MTQTKALRALTRAREDLVGTRVALANELRAQLGCFWPGAANVFSEIDSPIALAFLKQYPTPAAARGLGEQRLARFLARHSYSGGKPPRELLGRLRDAAQGRAGALETGARGQVVLALVAALEPIVAKIAQLTKEIRDALAEHRTARRSARCSRTPTPRSPPRRCSLRSVTAASATPPRRALAADGGQSPVAVESGKSKRARYRWACDHRLRNAIGTLADSSRQHNPWAQDIYQRAIARGASHPHAIRILGRAWCAVILRLWHDHDTYDPNRHIALQRLLATQTATA